MVQDAVETHHSRYWYAAVCRCVGVDGRLIGSQITSDTLDATRANNAQNSEWL